MKTNGVLQLYPVMRLALFLVIGIIIGENLHGVVTASAWFAVAAMAVGASLLVRKYYVAQTVLVFTATMSLGSCLVAHQLSLVDMDLAGDEVELEAVVVSTPLVTDKSVRCDLLVTDTQKPIKTKALFIRDGNAEQLSVGDGIAGRARLAKPANYAESDFDYRRYLLYHGYSATAFFNADNWSNASVSMRNLSVIERVRIAALMFRSRLLGSFKDAGIGGQEYAVVAAMALGERVSMSDGMIDDYSISGALHVLSLSGLHLGIIYAMLLLLFLGRRRSVLVQVAVVCSVWAYVFIVGMPVSAVRSAVMLSVYSFVCLLNRDRMSLNTLAVAAVAVLVCNPLNLYDVGFQMSFVSVLFIILFYKPIFGLLPENIRMQPVVKWIWQITAVSFSAQLGVAPLVAYYFGRFSCYFLLSNFVVVPASTVILYGAVFVILFGWQPWLQTVLCGTLAKVVDFMNTSVSFVASLPGASIENISINKIQVLLIYLAIFSVSKLATYIPKMYHISKLTP